MDKSTLVRKLKAANKRRDAADRAFGNWAISNGHGYSTRDTLAKVVPADLQDALRKAEDECHELDCAGIRLGHVYLREQRCRIWIGRFPRGQEMSTRQVI